MVRTEDIWPLAQEDCDWLDIRIDLAIHDTRKETREMSVYELKQALRDITGIDQLTISNAPNGNQLLHIEGKTLEVGPMASNDEIRLALQNPFIRTENTRMSVTGLRAGAFQTKLAEMRQRIAGSQAKALSTIDGIVTAGEAKLEQAANESATKAQREIDDALAEFTASGDNGGPA